jgi:chromatin remodeling complex protein RSC6
VSLVNYTTPTGYRPWKITLYFYFSQIQSWRERERERERERMSFAASRVFKACRALLAPAKPATASKTTVAKPKPKPKPKPKAKATSTTPGTPRGILKPNPVSPVLGDFLGGVPESSRAEAVKKIWAHIKLHNLQVSLLIIS